MSIFRLLKLYRAQTESKYSDPKSYDLYNSLPLSTWFPKDPLNMSSNQNQDKEERSLPHEMKCVIPKLLFSQQLLKLTFFCSLNTYKHVKTTAPAIFSPTMNVFHFPIWIFTGFSNRTHDHLNNVPHSILLSIKPLCVFFFLLSMNLDVSYFSKKAYWTTKLELKSREIRVQIPYVVKQARPLYSHIQDLWPDLPSIPTTKT